MPEKSEDGRSGSKVKQQAKGAEQQPSQPQQQPGDEGHQSAEERVDAMEVGEGKNDHGDQAGLAAAEGMDVDGAK